nr:hypothetical protein [Dolosigranulum pigrum]
MSKTNSILNLIGIQDENIKLIEKNPIKTSGPNEIIYATLTYQPQGCCKCGIKNDGSIIIKYGTKTSREKQFVKRQMLVYVILVRQLFNAFVMLRPLNIKDMDNDYLVILGSMNFAIATKQWHLII